MNFTNLSAIAYSPSFTSYNKIDKTTGLSTSTSFYHDATVLEKASELIQETFPKGTNILVYAGSNGEEALSLNTLLKNRNNYNIYSIDTCDESINYANIGVYAIHPCIEDSFLISEPKTDDEKRLSNLFHKNFIEIPKPKKQIDNLTDTIYRIQFDNKELFPQRYFVPNSTISKNIHYIIGDINNIKDFSLHSNNNKAGAIFFRNAFYHIVDNDLTGVLNYGDEPNLDLNKREVLDELVNNKIYNKLEVGGYLVLGNHLQEHLYIADKSVPIDDTILVDSERNIRYMKKHPLLEVLTKSGNFKPVFNSVVEGLGQENDYKLPLIWQKVK